jgi:hypothetical protein
MATYVESALTVSTSTDDTQKKKLQAGQELFKFLSAHPSTENYEVDDGKLIRLNPLAFFLNAEHLSEDEAYSLTGIRATATRPHAISSFHQSALIALFLTERRMKTPRKGSDVTQRGGGRIYAPTSTQLLLARLLSFLHEAEERLVMTKVLPQDYPATRRDCDTGAYKVIPGLLNAFYREAVKWDPGCAASKKAARISTGESDERFASEEFARKSRGESTPSTMGC